MRDHDVGRGNGWRAPGCDAESRAVVVACLAALDGALDASAGLSLSGLSDADVTRVLDQLTTGMGRVTALAARAAAEADRRRLGDSIGARHTGHWWASWSRLTSMRPSARRSRPDGSTPTRPT